MNSTGIPFDQVIVGLFSLVMLGASFVGLNNCSKETRLVIRFPLVLFLTAAAGTLLLIVGGITVHWSHSLAIVGITIHLLADRRPTNVIFEVKKQPQRHTP